MKKVSEQKFIQVIKNNQKELTNLDITTKLNIFAKIPKIN